MHSLSVGSGGLNEMKILEVEDGDSLYMSVRRYETGVGVDVYLSHIPGIERVAVCEIGVGWY